MDLDQMPTDTLWRPSVASCATNNGSTQPVRIGSSLSSQVACMFMLDVVHEPFMSFVAVGGHIACYTLRVMFGPFFFFASSFNIHCSHA